MIVFVRAFCKIYSVLQSDQSGILRRLLKFPPVEDVRILVGMALKYKTRSISPSKTILRADPVPSPFLLKHKSVENSSPKVLPPQKKTITNYLDEAISIINDIVNEYFLFRKSYDDSKNNKAIDILNNVKSQLEKDASSPTFFDPLSKK